MKAFGVVVLLCAGVAVAHAQTPAPAVSDEARAKEHFRRGQELIGQGRHNEAYGEFEAGYGLSRRALFLFNMGECARAVGDTARARDAYERYVQEDPGGSLAPLARQRLIDLGAAPATVSAPASPVAPSEAAPAKPAPPRLSLVPPAGEATKKIETKPVWKRWPLWVGLGAGLAAIAAVTGGVVYATTQGGPACGAGCVDFR